MFNLDTDFFAFDSFCDDLERDCSDRNFDWDLEDELEPELSMADEFPQLADHLRKQGAILVRLEYSGQEGEGRFLDLRTFGQGYREIEVYVPAPLLNDLREYCSIQLQENRPEWNRGHGGCGDFGWDLQKNTFTHVHRPYEREAISVRY